jgi:hypothetical protein
VFALALAALTGLLFVPGLRSSPLKQIRSRRQEPAEAPTPSSRIRLVSPSAKGETALS